MAMRFVGSAGYVSCDTHPGQWIEHPCIHKPMRRPGPSTVTGQWALLSSMADDGPMRGCLTP